MAGITTSTLTGMLPEIHAATKQFLSNKVMLSDFIDVHNVPAEVAAIHKWGDSAGLSVASVAQNAAPTGDDVTGAKVTVTANRIAGSVLLSDLANFTSGDDLIEYVGRDFADKIGSKINQDIFALFDGFSTAIGTSNVNITTNLVMQARAKLRRAGAPGPYTLAITPDVEADLLNLLGDSTGSAYALSNQVVLNGALTNAYGCNVVVVQDLASATLNAADAKCGMFAKEALVMNIANPLRIQLFNDIEKGATRIVADIHYGLAELKDNYGVELLVDNNDSA